MSFDAITYNEAHRLRAHFLLLNGSPEALEILLGPDLTHAAFDTWLGQTGKLATFQQLLSAPSGAAAMCASATAMAAVAASSTAMAAVAASSTAMAAVAASSTAMAAVAASSTAMAAVVASSTAMAAVAASSTAMAAVRQSTTALTAINSSTAALDALYGAATKFNRAGGSWSANPTTLVTGAYLLVRITTKGNPAGFGIGSYNEYVKIAGAFFPTTSGAAGSGNNISTRAENPYIQDKAARPCNAGQSITYYCYNPIEIAYIPA